MGEDVNQIYDLVQKYFAFYFSSVVQSEKCI